MSKKNDDSVERFFRKAVAQQDDTFIQRDWEKMEKLLDAEAAKATVARYQRIKRAIFRGATVTGILALVYFLVSNQQHPESRLVTDALVQESAVAGAEAPTTKPRTEYPSTATLLPKRDFFPASEVEKKKAVSDFIRDRANSRNIQSFETVSFGEQNMSSSGYSQEIDRLASENDERISERPLTPKNISFAQRIVEEQKKQAIAKNETLDPCLETDSESPSRKKEEHQMFSRWNVALAFAPDFSTTELNRYSAPGDAYGINLGFNISRRFSISTGVLKSSKRYEGYGSEYQPPEGYWQRRTNGVVPNEVKGNCTILEFPITVQYQLNTNSRHRIFAAAGVSSYYMLDEAYYYQFEDPNPGAAESWSSDEPSSYSFAVGHLSAGYERQLSRNISIGIEPFLKIPFAGIGWTNIELFTTGAYLNVRYRFTRKNQQLE
jgi:hypothetical protein